MKILTLIIGRKAVHPTDAPAGVPGSASALDAADVPSGTEPLPVTAKDLWRTFADNQIAGEILYGERLLLVSGEVDNVDRDHRDRIRVNLKVNAYNVVHAFFPDDARDMVSTLRPDQAVRFLARINEADSGKVTLEAVVGA